MSERGERRKAEARSHGMSEEDIELYDWDAEGDFQVISDEEAPPIHVIFWSYEGVEPGESSPWRPSEEEPEPAGGAAMAEVDEPTGPVETSGGGRVWAEYHQFYLCDDESTEWDGREDNGLIAPLPAGGAVVVTGIALGYVRYEWATYDERPEPSPGAWDESAEVRIMVRGGLHVTGWGAMSSDPNDLASRGPGEYIVRCSVHDRGDDSMTSGHHPTERYLIEVWPA